MANSAVKQLSESQRLSSELQVEPDAKVMQSDLCSQACLEAIQRVRTLTSQSEGIEQLVIDRFNDLPQPSQPASPGFGPAHFTALMWGTDHICAVGGLPAAMQQVSCKAFVSYIDALGWGTGAGQARRGRLAHGEKGLGQ